MQPRTFACLYLVVLIATHEALGAGKQHALLVGVEKYRHAKLEDLKYCGDDVLALEKVLAPQGFQCVVLRNDSDPDAVQPPSARLPTAANIQAALRTMLASVTKDDTVLVVLTGHGLQPAGSPQPFFCPMDANPSWEADENGKQTLDNPETLIGIGALLKQLDKSGAGEKLVLIDACRNAPALKGMKGGVDRVAFELLPEQCGLLLSCAQGQFSFESDKLGGKGSGVFLHHVIEGLNGAAKDANGDVTWDSLVQHVKLSVPKTVTTVFGRESAARQTPHQIANLAGTSLLARVKSVAEAPKTIISTTTGMKLVLIPKGEFLRGSPDSDKDASDDEKPQHQVRITQDFYMGQHEVTQGDWKTVMGTEPWKRQSYVKEGKDFPVSNVSWTEADEFCRKLSQRDGRTYRLPTEAEWEYACRGSTTTRFSFGDDELKLSEFAWWGGLAGDGNAKTEQYAHQVGLKKPNPFGLFDMHGNVQEWCGDGYAAAEYAKHEGKAVLDPQGPSGQASNRVVRGGGWIDVPGFCRSAHRLRYSPVNRYSDLGFRVLTVQSSR